MKHPTVELTVKSKLCCSCGICKNMCPKDCISWKRENGMYYPQIDSVKCVQCGICAEICPGIGFSYGEQLKEPIEAVTGTYLALYNAWSKNSDLRHVSASGGVVSTLVCALLNEGKYNVAFCVNSYQYQEQLVTKPYTQKDILGEWKDSSIPKSRYLPVSHENAISYIKNNRDDRVIVVGTSCAIRGIINVINKLKLNREQYLLIGLFCDKVFNYNVQNYFENTFCANQQLKELHFKNKESGGWPGNMKFYLGNGECFYKDKSEREKVKEHFMPERCLYCIDKLNVCADISLGDNYTGQNSSVLGSNSVIIRSHIGVSAWEDIAHELEFSPVSIEAIRKAQYIDGRLNNLYFGELKCQSVKRKYAEEINVNKGIILMNKSVDYEQAWKRSLKKLAAGANYDCRPQMLGHQFRVAKRKKSSRHPVVLLERIYYAVRRGIKK